MRTVVALKVNGVEHRAGAEPGRSLLTVLRDELGLTGAKYGCGEGRCGACTVLVDGEAVRSCLVRIEAVAGKAVTTIEGLEGPDGELHPLQQAFLDENALQCGYCTPGMILGGVALLEKGGKPDTAKVAEAMDGHVCRCGAYPEILAAICKAAEGREGGR